MFYPHFNKYFTSGQLTSIKMFALRELLANIFEIGSGHQVQIERKQCTQQKQYEQYDAYQKYSIFSSELVNEYVRTLTGTGHICHLLRCLSVSRFKNVLLDPKVDFERVSNLIT